MPPGNPSQVLTMRNAFRKKMITDLLHTRNVHLQVKNISDETKDRSESNKVSVIGIHNANKKEGFGTKRYSGYENGHDTKQVSIHEARMSAEEILREDRQNGIEFQPSALEIARENYLNVVKTYAAVEQKHRSMMEGLNKWFNATNLGSKITETRVGKRFKYEDNADVKGERRRFEDSLTVYRETWKKDIERRMTLEEGTDGRLEGDALKAEIAKMLTEFNCEAALELGAQRNFAKAEILWGGETKTKYKKPLQKADADFDGEQQSFTGRETHLVHGVPMTDQEGNPVVGKKNGQVIYGKSDRSVYDDVYKNEQKDPKDWKQLLHKGFDASWAGLEMIGGAYKKLPTSVKIGLGVATWASGIGALVVGKRVIGGIAVGVGTAGALNARQEQVFKKKAAAENELNLKEIEKEGVVDFEKLIAITDGQIKQIDDKMNHLKVKSWFNKAAGITLGVAIGKGWAQDAAKYGWGKLWNGAKYLYGAAGFISPPVDAAEIPAAQMHAGVGSSVSQNEYEQFKNINEVHAPASIVEMQHPEQESIDMNASAEVNHESVNIKLSEPMKDASGKMRHDSMIKSLKNYLHDGVGLENAEAGHVAELAFHDAAKEYAATHGITPEEAMAKFSKVHPGTSYGVTWDSHGIPKVHIEDEHMKFVKSSVHHHASVEHGHASIGNETEFETPKAPEGFSESHGNGMADNHPANFEKVVDGGTIQDWNQGSIDDAHEKIATLTRLREDEYGKMLKDGMRHALDGDSPSKISSLERAQKYWEGYLERMNDFSEAQSYASLRKDFFDGDVTKFRELRTLPVLNAEGKLNVDAIDHAGLKKQSRELIKSFMSPKTDKELLPVKGETFEKWTERIVKFAKKTSELKNENLKLAA